MDEINYSTVYSLVSKKLTSRLHFYKIDKKGLVEDHVDQHNKVKNLSKYSDE